MRRIDAIAITFGFFLIGGLGFLVLRWSGLNEISAGVWSQVLLFGGLLLWLGTYAYRAIAGKMTYHEQVDAYKKAVLQKQLEEMTPEARAKLFAELGLDNDSNP